KAPDGTANVMTVMAWPTGSSGARPELALYTVNGTTVPAQVLVNEDGTQVIQLPQAGSNDVYLLGVSHASSGQAGDFFLGIDYGSHGAHLDTLISSQPVSATGRPSGTLRLQQSQLFHLVLSAGGLTARAGEAVRLEVRGQAGNLVLALTAAAGESASTNV